MKFVIDANLSPLWVRYLGVHGFEATHWYSLGSGTAPDAEIMAYAAQYGFVILTRDLDFGIMLFQLAAARPSVVQIRAHPSEPADIGPQVVRALQNMEEDLRAGVLLTIEANRTRARLLPFRSEEQL